eukprot:6856790-Prymnesium_polylepis.2
MQPNAVQWRRALRAVFAPGSRHYKALTAGTSVDARGLDDPLRSLDSLTYVAAEFHNTLRPSQRCGPLRLLVDTGSNETASCQPHISHG